MRKTNFVKLIYSYQILNFTDSFLYSWILHLQIQQTTDQECKKQKKTKTPEKFLKVKL